MVDSCVMHTGKVRLKRGKMVRAASSVRLPQSDCERWADGRVNGPAGLFPRFRPRLRTLHPALSPTPCGHASAQPALGATSFPLITAVDLVRIMHFFLLYKSMIWNILNYQIFIIMFFNYNHCL